MLLKIWLYGVFEKIYSTRDLEKACKKDLPLVWLTGMNYPDHNTLWRFFHVNRDALEQVFSHSVTIAYEGGLVGLCLQAIDGTKIYADVCQERSLHLKNLKALRKVIESGISEVMEKVESVEQHEHEDGCCKASYKLPKWLENRKNMDQLIKDGLEKLSHQERQELKLAVDTSINNLVKEGIENLSLTAPESPMLKINGKASFGYNGQCVVDAQDQILVGAKATPKCSDNELLNEMLEESESNLSQLVEEKQNPQSREEKRECDNDKVSNSSCSASVSGVKSESESESESDNDNDNCGETKPESPEFESHLLKPVTLTDGGYFSSEELKKAREKGYSVLMPLSAEISGKGPVKGKNTEFLKGNFVYDELEDVYRCPYGGVLRYQSSKIRTSKRKHKKKYQVRVYHCKEFKGCEYALHCSKSTRGRTIERGEHAKEIEILKEKLEDQRNQDLLKRRKYIVEPVFGWIKGNHHFRRWSYRGLKSVNAQWQIICTVMNLKKLIRRWLDGTLKIPIYMNLKEVG